MMKPNAVRGRGRVAGVRKGPGLPRPARYDKVSTARGRARVPLVIDGITHYSTAEAAERLGLSLSTVKGAIATGTLAHRVVGPRKNMVPEPALEEYRHLRLGRRGRPKGAKNKNVSATADSHSAEQEERPTNDRRDEINDLLKELKNA